ncbi:MAG: mandelate racemase/muconate lactonizing enzyme family protein [Acidobacteria bacterium]|nr:mandelate racemase/muconate lactonizing enzyme family protein [Acidobacteriota bacterium]
MRIRDVEAVNLRFAYPAGAGFQFASGTCNARVTTLIRIHTDTGAVGLGSVYSHPDVVRLLVEGQFRELLVGEDPLEVERIWALCYGITRWYGRKGAAVSTLGGIDIALWDLRAKAAGLPLYRVLGGAVRRSVPVYASALLWKPDTAALGEEARRHVARGFLGMKMRLGRSYAYDSEALRVVREAIGPERRLMIEGNARYPLAQAVRLAPEFRAAGVFWLEEPFLPENPEDFRRLRAHLGGAIPLAAGENEFGEQGFAELMADPLVDIVQPDACRCGGVTASVRVAARAARHGLRVAPHTWSDAVALVANMHVVASQPHGITVEMDQTGNPLIEGLLRENLRLVDGELALPQGPGLGIELDEAVVERYAMKGPVAAGNYSDMMFGRGEYAPAGEYEG